MRAATGGGANDEEARGAESRAGFIHEVGIANKELREALYWLQLTEEEATRRYVCEPVRRRYTMPDRIVRFGIGGRADVAEVVWRAANDGSDQLRYPAGPDAVALAAAS